jgi:hypothetical protein
MGRGNFTTEFVDIVDAKVKNSLGLSQIIVAYDIATVVITSNSRQFAVGILEYLIILHCKASAIY